MIPIKDSPRAARFPIVNITLIVINVLAFLFELSLGAARLEGFIYKYGVVPIRLWAVDWRVWESAWGGIVPLLTATFVHAGWIHIGGNMLFLWTFGDNVEDRLGHVGYVAFYLLCGAGAALAQALIAKTSTVPMVGASGAIAGVMGAYLILYPRAKVLTLIPAVFWFWTINVTAWIYLVFWFLLQLFAGVLTLGGASGGVAWWAHLGGFAFGVIFVLIFPKTRRYPYAPAP